MVLLLLALAFPVVQELGPQSSSRFTFTGALVDDGTIRLDDQLDGLGVDFVEHDGHTYSDKLPGQPVLAVPFYAVARWVGARPSSQLDFVGNLGLWWLAIWFALVPAVGIVLATWCPAQEVGPLSGALGVGSLVFGWLLLPFSIQLYAHPLVGLLGYGAWLLLRRGADHARAGIAGAMLGLAVVSEYQMVLIAAILVGWLVLQRRRLDALTLVASGLPFALLLGWYQWTIFGDPLQTTYGAKPIHAASSTAILGVPTPRGFAELMVGDRGVLLFTPVVLAAVVGLVELARRPGPRREDARVGLVVMVSFVFLTCGWRNPWGGEEPGPRYLIAALPFLVIGAAEAWRYVLVHRRWLPVLRVATIWSVANMVGPLVTPNLIPDGTSLVRAWASRIAHGQTVPTLFTLSPLGDWGWVLHGTLVVGAAVNLWSALRVLPVDGAGGEGRVLAAPILDLDGATSADRHDP